VAEFWLLSTDEIHPIKKVITVASRAGRGDDAGRRSRGAGRAEYGIAHVVAGMARYDHDIQLTRYDGYGSRAAFYATGREHSRIAATGSA